MMISLGRAAGPFCMNTCRDSCVRPRSIKKKYGTQPCLRMEKGMGACHKSEAKGKFSTARGTPRELGFRDEAFWQSQVVNFGPPNPATDEKDRGNESHSQPSKGA
jgi:hypothetical protein